MIQLLDTESDSNRDDPIPAPNIDPLVLEDDTPMDNLQSEKQQRLLVEPLYRSKGLPAPFLAAATGACSTNSGDSRSEPIAAAIVGLLDVWTLDVWTKTSGTWINLVTVLVGTAIGMRLRGRLPIAMQQVMTQGLGLITLFIGISMAGSLNKVQAGAIAGVIVGLLAIVVGGLLGEWWQLDTKLQAIGDWLKQQVHGTGRRGSGDFTEGFVAASLLFCVGPMALIGSLNNGLTRDSALLTVKATMDGLAAIALSSSFGVGVGFSALPILVYQGGLSLAAAGLAQSLPNPASNPLVLLVSGVGGLMVMGIGLNLLEVTTIRIASFLPALLLAPIGFLLGSRGQV